MALPADDLPVLPSNFFHGEECTHWSWERDFSDVQEIGKGKDTIIYSAICPKLGHRRVAVKMYDKTKVQATKYRAIKREIAIMMHFMRKRLPSVVEYYGAFHDDAHLYIVMEYCGGGDLLEKLLRDRKAMHEKRVALEVAVPCLSILRTMHEMSIIHRDIKLENIFIDDAGKVKMGDFGLTMSMRQESAISPVGTVEYMAPEVVALPPVDLVISGQIKATDIPPTNEKVDIWALGVTIYELVTGRLPFEGKDKPEIKRNITSNNLAPLPTFLTPQCQSFIRAMLTYSATERPSCAQLLQHPYITMYYAPPKPAALPNVIALHAYSPGAAHGVAPPAPVVEAAREAMGVEGCTNPVDGSNTSSSNNSSRGAAGWQPSPRPRHSPGQSAPASSPPFFSYRDALAGGRAPAPPADDTRSPRTPGGSHVPVTVSRNAAATCAQHSPTILAQSGYTSRHDPFSSPPRPQESAGAAPAVPRKISFDFFSPAAGNAAAKAAAPAQLPGETKAGRGPALVGEAQGEAGAGAGERRGLVDHCADGQAFEPCEQAALSPAERKRGNSFSGNMKFLRKLFTRRGQHQHQRLEDMDAELHVSQPHPMQPSFSR